MNRKLLCIVIICITTLCLIVDFTHAQETRPIIRLIYILPEDREPDPDIDEKMDAMIKYIQQFFADEMERHGYGRKTIIYQADQDGKAIVHKMTEDQFVQYDRGRDIHLIVIQGQEYGGFGSAWSPVYGVANIGYRELDYPYITAIHELGHAFGLQHDFRSDVFLMSYGGLNSDRLSKCTAEWLDVHRAFNDEKPSLDEDQRARIEMLPTTFVSIPNKVKLRFKVSDPDGLHQVQFLIFSSTASHPGKDTHLIGCKTLSGTSSIVEFITSDLTPNNNEVGLQIIDKYGNGLINNGDSFPGTWFHVDVKASVPPKEIVSFPDKNLEDKIWRVLRNTINPHILHNEPTITSHLLLDVRILFASNSNIKNLTGIEYAKNLELLYLGSEHKSGEGYVNRNKILDFTPIDGLINLLKLDLSQCSISDASFLSELINMEVLLLQENRLTDISVLSGMNKLITLDISNNPISDISPLARLTNLKDLSLHYTSISHISILSELPNLNRLNLTNNTISDISALSELTDLTSLFLGSNNISDISDLKELTQLKTLYLPNNNISDVSPLLTLNLTGTKWDSTGLYLGNNPLSYTSINTHIPAMQAKGIGVQYDQRTPTKLLKISGDVQQAVTNSEIPLPFVVEVRDQYNRVYAEVPVTFSITKGNGKLNTLTTTTDVKGRAKAAFTLGQTEGETTIRVTAAKISQPIQFTVKAILPTSFVNLPDTNLAAKITETLGKPTSASITVTDMLSLTSLTANNTSISDLTGLKHASNLTTLMLDGNNLSNIEPLIGLTQLTTLSLDNNILSDISPLVELTQLETLSLENNKLSGVAPLVELSELKTLRLRGNLLSYPSLYTTIPILSSRGVNVMVDPRTPTTLINVPGTPGITGATLQVIVQVQDQKGFAFAGVPVNFTLTAAGEHRSTSNAITNLNGTAITTLTLGPDPGKNTVSATVIEIPQPLNFTITTIDANTLVHIPDVNLHAKIVETLNKPKNTKLNAGDLLELTRLDAQNANIQELTGIEYAHNLRLLNLGAEYIEGKGIVNSNSVSNFSPLIRLTTLTYLNLSHTKLVDLSALSALTNLNTLRVDNNNISDLSALSGLTNLTWLELSSNSISDISALSGLTNLASLGLNSTNISDVSPLSGLTQLIYLQLFGNNISDVSPLSQLTKLTQLGLDSNNILDISPLLGLNLTGTQWDSTGLFLGNNPLSYTSINTHIPAMQVKGIEVQYDKRTPTRLLKITGDTQQAFTNKELPLPFVVEVQDQWNRVFAEVPITFSITKGSGKLDTTMTKTDTNGRAQTRLTFGETGGTTTVQVTVPNNTQRIQFTATASSLDLPVSLPDDNLYAKIVETLGKPRGVTLTLVDMLRLTSFTANNAGISNLTGLQHASNLTTLMLDGNNLSNIEPLTELTQLTILSLDINNLSDIAPIVELTQLETLSLENNNLSDIAPIVELTELKTLRLRGNLLSYPALYSTIPILRARGVYVAADTRTPTTLINLPGPHRVANTAQQVVVQVKDQNGVAMSGVPVNFDLIAADGHRFTSKAVTNLNGKAATTLTLGPEPGENSINVTVTEIPQPLNFTIIVIDVNTLVHIPDVNLKTKIVETLNIPKNAELNAGDLLALTSLDAQNANIQDLTGIEYAHNLRSLNLSTAYIQGKGYVNGNTVSDLSPLIGLTTLTYLYLSNTKLIDLSALSALTNLNTLHLSGNNISDISALSGLTNLNTLNLDSNRISDISALSALTNLTWLDLHGNNISDISALSGLANLTALNLNSNKISDISPLLALNLIGTQWFSTGLHVKNNPLNNEAIRTHIPAMQAKGFVVSFDNITHPEFMIISGDKQEELVGRTLPSPFVVEYRDADGKPKEGVNITFSIADGDAELTDSSVTTDSDGRAQTFLRRGWKLGTITVNVNAESINSQLTFTSNVVLPENHVSEDVNADGIVDVEDLVLVAATIGTTPPDGTIPNPDVNGDGVINSDDLALVMDALESTPTAPAVVMTAENLQRCIDEVKQLANKDATILRGIEVLEQLLETLLPKKTALLANYPNPFNPETWIPYHLAKPAEVTIHIYGVDGALVQTLALGQKPAGIYVNRHRAAYWDGRNAQGERVASGIYLYTLTVGAYTSIRKMLIRK